YFGDPSSLVEPETIAGELHNVKIAWSEDPEEIWIDGTKVAAGEIAGRTLRLMMPAHIFARSGGCFAFAEIAHPRGNTTEIATLQFVEPLPGTASAQELDAMRRDRKWFRLFLATASPAAQPRSPEVAFAFNRALYGLCLGAQIDASNAALAAHTVARASA